MAIGARKQPLYDQLVDILPKRLTMNIAPVT